jgi:hypothetical protein
VPHKLVRRSVEVVVGDVEVVVFDGTNIVARHARSSEPHHRVIDKTHFEGLCRVTTTDQITTGEFARRLADYAAASGGAW